MPSLKWSPGALNDVQRLYRFLRPKNKDAASRAVQAIRQGVEVLERHPLMGRMLDGMPRNYREYPVKFGDSGYMVLYVVEEQDDGSLIVILAVRHQREMPFKRVMQNDKSDAP